MTSATAERSPLLRHALRLEYATVGWNVIEAAVAIAAALAARSVALLGFGVDSVVETASGAILIWRLQAERRARSAAAIARLDRRAHRGVALSLFLLAGYIALDASRALWAGDAPAPSWVGIALTTISLVLMGWLVRAKRAAAAALGSRALEADTVHTTASLWLSAIVFAGIAINALLGWWWADPLAALAMTPVLVKEGREGWRGEEHCD